MPEKKIYFCSDAHLGSRYHADPLAAEIRLVSFLKSIEDDAREVFFLGDLFDYWFEYKDVVPRGFVRFLGQCAMMSDKGIRLHFFAGNHDCWMTDYFTKEFGAVVHHKSYIFEDHGKVFRLSHGDEEYTSMSLRLKWMYRLFNSKVARFFYAAIHPRWTVGFAYWLSLRSRKRGLKKSVEGRVPHAYRNDYFDVENEWLVKKTKEFVEKDPSIDFYLFGHRHIMLDLALKDQKRCIILGDWISYDSYAVWDGELLQLCSIHDFE